MTIFNVSFRVRFVEGLVTTPDPLPTDPNVDALLDIKYPGIKDFKTKLNAQNPTLVDTIRLFVPELVSITSVELKRFDGVLQFDDQSPIGQLIKNDPKSSGGSFIENNPSWHVIRIITERIFSVPPVEVHAAEQWQGIRGKFELGAVEGILPAGGGVDSGGRSGVG